MVIIRNVLYIERAKSTMKCKICGGWGGEWGHAKTGKAICYDCWQKGQR